jgi:hypothetical protein
MSDRKYRQRGYQDDARGDRRGPRRQGPRDKPEGPRGRGLGAPTRTVFRCASCGRTAELEEVSFESICAGCGTALHTCTHCRHFDTSARFECRQPLTEHVASKTKANRCELFEPKAAQEFKEEQRPAPGNPIDPDDPRAAFDALFKL